MSVGRKDTIFCDPLKGKRLLLICTLMLGVSSILSYCYYIYKLDGVTDSNGNIFGRDFVGLWVAVDYLKSGDLSALYDLPAAHVRIKNLFGVMGEVGYIYPPHFLFVLYPFIFVSSYKTAYILWALLNLATFMFAVFWRTGPYIDKGWKCVLLFAPMVFCNVYIGQNGALVAALIIGGFRLLGASRQVLAGIIFGVLSIKPHYALLMPIVLIALDKYKALASMIITIGILFVSSSEAFGTAIWIQFFMSLRHFAEDLITYPILKSISVYSNAVLLGVDPAISMKLQQAVSLSVLVVSYVALRRIKDRHWTEWMILIAPAVYLIVPHGFIYDLCFIEAAWIMWLAYYPQGVALKPYETLLWWALWFAPLYNNTYWYLYHLPVMPCLLLAAFGVRSYSAWKPGDRTTQAKSAR